MAKKRRNRQSPIFIVGEIPTPERRQQMGGVVKEVIAADANSRAQFKRHRAKIECSLDWYFATHRISAKQFQAGQKFREIFNRVTFGYHYKVLCNPFLIDGGKADPEARILAHMDCIRRLDEVYEMLSTAQRRVLIDICGYDERAKNGCNLKTFYRGLDALMEFWGY